MTHKYFSLVARNKYLELLSEFVVEAMKVHGYQETMEMKRPDNPEIWEFNKNGKIISMTITPHEGALSGQSIIRIETDSENDLEEVYDIIGSAIALLVKNISMRVFKAIGSKKARKNLLETIQNRISELSKDL
jgi:hypothetical protein